MKQWIGEISMERLNQLMSDPRVAAIAVPILLLILLVWVAQDWRAFRRKDPIKIWYLDDPIYPGDLLYPWAFLQRFGVYIGCLGALVMLIVALVVVAMTNIL